MLQLLWEGGTQRSGEGCARCKGMEKRSRVDHLVKVVAEVTLLFQIIVQTRKHVTVEASSCYVNKGSRYELKKLL